MAAAINWSELLGAVTGNIANRTEQVDANILSQNTETALAEKSFDHAAKMQENAMLFRKQVTLGILGLVVVIIAALAFVKTRK